MFHRAGLLFNGPPDSCRSAPYLVHRSNCSMPRNRKSKREMGQQLDGLEWLAGIRALR